MDNFENMVVIRDLNTRDESFTSIYKKVKFQRNRSTPELIDQYPEFWNYVKNSPDVAQIRSNLICEPCNRCYKSKYKLEKNSFIGVCNCENIKDCRGEDQYWDLTLLMLKLHNCHKTAWYGTKRCKMCQQEALFNKSVCLADEDPSYIQRERESIKSLNNFNPSPYSMKRNVYNPLKNYKICFNTSLNE